MSEKYEVNAIIQTLQQSFNFLLENFPLAFNIFSNNSYNYKLLSRNIPSLLYFRHLLPIF